MNKYRFSKGDWQDAERECDGYFGDLDQYDQFNLDFTTWMARFRNGRLAAVVLAFPGVVVLSLEHPNDDEALEALLVYINTLEPIQVWYNARADEPRFASLLGLVRSDLFDDDIYIKPGLSEIEIKRLLKRHELEYDPERENTEKNTNDHDGLD